jgi:exopolyphosphatase/guanosine-5'-triphosphate,3'-diphosphate pyrophosphatase
MSDVVAVIDIGSNTTRLLVRDKRDPSVDFAREVEITGLGKNLDSTGVLSDESMAHTREVVARYVARSLELGATNETISIFATAASRRSSNGRDFIDSLANEFSVSATIISGEEEGATAFAGAMSDVTINGPSVVFDIGGASTEFALSEISDPKKCARVKSIPVGSVVMTNRYIESDPPAPEDLTNIISEVREYLKELQIEMPEILMARTWVGVAATVTTTAAVELGLHAFDRDALHEFVLTKAAAEDVFRTLALEKLEDRIHNPGLEPQRADVIVGGIAIIVAIMRHFELGSIVVSCSDLLDGLWLSAANS